MTIENIEHSMFLEIRRVQSDASVVTFDQDDDEFKIIVELLTDEDKADILYIETI